MNWKILLWTLLLSLLLFFTLVYLGMKFQWVKGLQDKKILENDKVTLSIPLTPIKTLQDDSANKQRPTDYPETVDKPEKSTPPLHRFSHSLVGEAMPSINFSGMSLEWVIKECGRISKQVGVPADRLQQSITECTTRHFKQNAPENKYKTGDVTNADNIQSKLKKQCEENLPPDQQALFSREEMQLLIDECIVDLRKRQIDN
jgi:hypothetical protein